jgi:hypothetical protein
MILESIKLVERNNAKLFSPEMGLSRQVLAYSNQLMLVRHLMGKGWIGARHSHPHEQVVYVISDISGSAAVVVHSMCARATALWFRAEWSTRRVHLKNRRFWMCLRPIAKTMRRTDSETGQ